MVLHSKDRAPKGSLRGFLQPREKESRGVSKLSAGMKVGQMLNWWDVPGEEGTSRQVDKQYKNLQAQRWRKSTSTETRP